MSERFSAESCVHIVLSIPRGFENRFRNEKSSFTSG